MGLSSAIPWIGEATGRLLKRYGSRSGTIINATGTGTTLLLRAAWRDAFNSYDEWKTTCDMVEFLGVGDKIYIEISAFSNETEPIRVSSVSRMGVRRALSGRVYGYHKYEGIDVSIGVIGNSLDDYKLTMLSNMAKEKDFTPLFNLEVNSNSAKGYNSVIFANGIIESFNPGLNIGTNAKIRDKVFTFNFAEVTSPSWSDQKYDPTATPNIFADMIGF